MWKAALRLNDRMFGPVIEAGQPRFRRQMPGFRNNAHDPAMK
jgi:hypothetical protein